MRTTTGRLSRVLPSVGALGLAVLGVAGCYDLGVGAGGANPGAGTGGGGSSTYTVNYSASATGDGVLDNVQFLDANGQTVTVSDPALPFARTVTMSSGDDAAMSASGTVSVGSLSIRMRTSSSDGGGTQVDVSDGCQSDGPRISCSLSVSTVRLN